MDTPEEKNIEFEELVEMEPEEEVIEEADDGVVEIDESDDLDEEFVEADSEDEIDLGDIPEEDM